MSIPALIAAGTCLTMVAAVAAKALNDVRTYRETIRCLKQMAMSDILTGLPNRLSFDCELSRLSSDPTRTGGFAVVMIDLTRFKIINDTHGHLAGDELLTALAARFRSVLQPGQEFVARLGGDEFAILLPSAEKNDVSLRLERITAIFKDPFSFHRFTTHVGGNIGVALAPADGEEADLLLARADRAMYWAKQAHCHLPCFYTPAMDRAVPDRRDVAQQLRAAIGTDDLHLQYQPQWAIQTRAVTGYEALCRWQIGAERSVPPAEFIPLAEEIGEIVRLGTWVLDRACRDAMSWPTPHNVSVNISPLQLTDDLLVSTVARVLRDTGLPPHRLELDLTEGAILRDRDRALRQSIALKALGISLALDDYGVGASSLDILHCFPFDRIKLGPSLIADAVGDPQSLEILGSIALLGRKLDLSVLAGGIETTEQLELAVREGCAGAQGYLLGRPARQLADPEAIGRTTIATLSRSNVAARPTRLRKRLLLPTT